MRNRPEWETPLAHACTAAVVYLVLSSLVTAVKLGLVILTLTTGR